MMTLSGQARASLGSKGGFTLAEVMISVGIFSGVSLALLMGSTAMQRSSAAVNRYSIDHAAQLRLSDYLAMDLRRSISVGALGSQNTITMVIAQYMPTPAPSPTPTPTPYAPQLDAKSGVVYYSPQPLPPGTAMSAWPQSNYTVTVSYYLSGGSVYRAEGSASPVALADNVEDFVFQTASADVGKVVETTITFKPTFRSNSPSADVVASTTFHNRTLLRNNVTVY